MDLDVASGGSELEGLVDEGFPITHTAKHGAEDDEVELFGEGPGVLEVVDLKVDIWWDPSGLDGALRDMSATNFPHIRGNPQCLFQ